MQNLKTKLLVLSFVLASVFTLCSSEVFAQQQAGITVTPGVIKTSVSGERTSQLTDVTVRNNYEIPVRLTAELRNVDETSARLVPSGELSGELRDVLRLSDTDIVIPARSDKRISVQASFTAALKPGGHYAALMLSEQSVSSASLSLRSAVSVAIYLTNETGVSEKFDLQSFDSSSTVFSLPKNVTVSLKNSGNVHSIPRGVATVIGTNGKIISKGVINVGSNPVLPGKEFEANVALSHISRPFWPQRINISLEYHGDQSSQITEASRKVLYIPPIFIFCLLALLGAVVLLGKYVYPLAASKIRKLHVKSISKKRKKARQQPIHIQDIVKIDNNRGKK